MNLKELKEIFDSVDDDCVLSFGLSEVRSWRGSYDEVCFTVGRDIPAAKSKLLILRAYTEVFTGYKGGDYRYGDHTEVNFESSSSSYSDGEYRESLISEITGGDVEIDRDLYLSKLLAESAYPAND